MDKKAVLMAQNGTLNSLGITAISTGVALIAAADCWATGLLCVGVGVGLVFLREYLKNPKLPKKNQTTP